MIRQGVLAALLALIPPVLALADGPADNIPENVRRIPKPGIEVPDADRKALEDGLAVLEKSLADLEKSQDARVRDLLPDVQIFHKAVHDALKYQEFFAPNEIKKATSLLKTGQKRADALANGQAPWTTERGLVVRGYRSKIDGSIQPYGLVIPESYDFVGKAKYRLDIWFHGRGETLSEVNFLDEHMKQPGQFTPQDTIVLHPYGRYCNAFRFAGEVDVYEALESTQTHYKIDPDRTSVRGFSMGGAACWQFAVHDSSRWFAANPGAGFSETARFLDVFQKEKLTPTWYEQKLWRLYDCDIVATNLHQCPTVAYSGEIDTQKQAADVMEEALKKVGIRLTHVIGPQTKHAYHPDSKKIVEAKLDSLAVSGRERSPREIRFATYTLGYNRMNWLTVDALNEHWEKTLVRAEIEGTHKLFVGLSNVSGFTIDMPAGTCPLESLGGEVRLSIGDLDQPRNQELVDVDVPGPLSDGSWHVSVHRDGDTWKLGPLPSDGLRKKHGLQGPIDDAFMDSFVFVKPSGQCREEKVQKWVDSEFDRAVEHWRRQFRGEARVKTDSEVSDEDIKNSNLILWGDPESNAIWKKIADKLPIAWSAEAIKVGDRSYPADHHALIAIYPNPLNPDRYVVLNSSFTYRDYDYLNNARQVPKLPDWAIVDLNTPPGSRYPGKIVDADFFDEQWQLKPPHENP